MFTHHQKTIILDGPSSTGAGRQVISFVGGLDLCDGRYDTADHPLFKTCCEGGTHCADFHQACIEGKGDWDGVEVASVTSCVAKGRARV
jgi:phospholipase D1/2